MNLVQILPKYYNRRGLSLEAPLGGNSKGCNCLQKFDGWSQK